MPIVIAWARKRNLVAKPDARKIHKVEIARVGGIAIFVGAMLAIMPVLLVENHLGEAFRGQAFQIAALLLASTVMFGVGHCRLCHHRRHHDLWPDHADNAQWLIHCPVPGWSLALTTRIPADRSGGTASVLRWPTPTHNNQPAPANGTQEF